MSRVPVTAIVAITLSVCAALGYADARTRQPSPNPFGLYLGARSAENDQDISDAASLYRDSLALDPNNPDLLEKAFFYTAASGDFSGAVRLAKQVVSVAQDDRAARLALAIRAL